MAFLVCCPIPTVGHSLGSSGGYLAGNITLSDAVAVVAARAVVGPCLVAIRGGAEHR